MTMDIRDAVDGGLLLFSAECAVPPDVQQLFQWPAQTGGAEDAGQVDQAGEATGGVGTAGETEQIDLVAGVVVVTEKAEAVDDVGIQSCSAEAAADLLSIAGAYAAAVVEDLAGARLSTDGMERSNLTTLVTLSLLSLEFQVPSRHRMRRRAIFASLLLFCGCYSRVLSLSECYGSQLGHWETRFPLNSVPAGLSYSLIVD